MTETQRGTPRGGQSGGVGGSCRGSDGEGNHTASADTGEAVGVDTATARETAPDGQGGLPVCFTVYQSPERLTKAYTLDDGGNTRKTPAAAMTEGKARRVSVDFAQFGAELAKASERVAFGYGLHDADAYGGTVKIAVAAKAEPGKRILARTREFFDYRAGPGVVMIDHDPSADGPAVTPGQLRGILAAVCPGFSAAACWERGSLSAGITIEGGQHQPGRGFHLYFPVLDAADIPRFGKVLFKRLWLAGHGFIALSAAGSFLVRSAIDAAVFDGERLDFVGRPVVGPGLAYTPPEAVFHEGGYLDTALLPALDDAEESRFKALVAQAKQAREADRQAQRAKWEETHVKAMTARGVPEPAARAQVRQIPADGKPADLYRDWPLEFAALGFATVGDVLANPARYDGAALADPFEGVGYGRSTAMFYANRGGKPCIHSHAHGGARYFLKATAGPEPRHDGPPFDPGYYARVAPMADEDGALIDPTSPTQPPSTQESKSAPRRGLGGGELRDPADRVGRSSPPPFQPMEWPDPIIPGAAVTPEVPADLLPSWVGCMAEAVALHTKTPQAMAVMLALSVLATVLQRRFEVAPRGIDYGYTEPLSLWTVTALPPGTNKTSVLNLLRHPLDRWEKLARDRMRRDVARVLSARDVAAKRIEALKVQAGKAKTADEREKLRAEIQQETEDMPAELFPPQLITTSVTPESLEMLLAEQHERMAILSDEGGIFQIMSGQYSGGVANIDVYLKGHSGSSMQVNRAKRKAHLEKPALSFGLAIQPGILAESAKTKRFDDAGLLARFLYALPKSNVGTRDVRERFAIPAQVKAAWEAGIHGLLDGMDFPIGAPKVLPLDDDAEEHWLDFAQKVENSQGEGGQFEHISDWTSKLPGAVARIAGLLHLAEHGTEAKTVDLDSVQRAAQLGRLLTPHAVAAFALMGASKAETDALQAYKWIKARGRAEFTRREIQAGLRRRIPTLKALTEALKQLADQSVISPELLTDTGEKGGRPSPYYEVNPKLL